MWNSADIVQATSGTLKGGAFEASSVAIDSRTLAPGALFVAIAGDRVDGHEYLQDAFARGAVGALTHRSDIASGMPLVQVRETLEALVNLAKAARARTGAKIIAVTGSVGKTGTKEAIRLAAGSGGKIYATQGNLNNHIGLPLSLANLPQNAKFGVFELGMNHAGEISNLTRILRPDISVITTVEAVHLEFFADVAGIADAKAEIMEGMGEDSTIILNRDNAYFDRLKSRATSRGIRNIVTFGAHEQAHCRLLAYTAEGLGSRVEALIHGTRVAYALGTVGRHYAFTSLAALAAATAAGADLTEAAAALAQFREPEGRGRITSVNLPQGRITLIDDCYNASPVSTKAGLAKLAELHTALGGKGRKVAVLGDMLELGEAAASLHRELLVPLNEQKIDRVFAAGPLMQQLYESLPAAMRGRHEASAAALAKIVPASLKADDIVLIKGSRGSRMDIVRDAIMAGQSHPAKESAHVV